MKKILILLLVLTSISIAQTTTAKASQINGKKTLWKSAGGDTVSSGVHITGGGLSTFPGGQTYANVRNSWDWARSFVAYADTVRSDSVLVVRSRDTLTIGGTEWSKVTIKAGAADSISFGIGTVEPTVWYTLYAGQTFTSEKLSKTYFTKVFIKGAGVADHIESYQVIIEAF